MRGRRALAVGSHIWTSWLPRSNSCTARSRSRSPLSSCATTCCNSRYAASKLSAFGLNEINRTGQATAMQLNAQTAAELDRGGVVQDVAARFDNGIATVQRRRGTERSEPSSARFELLAGAPQAIGHLAQQAAACIVERPRVLVEPI